MVQSRLGPSLTLSLFVRFSILIICNVFGGGIEEEGFFRRLLLLEPVDGKRWFSERMNTTLRGIAPGIASGTMPFGTGVIAIRADAEANVKEHTYAATRPAIMDR